MALHPTRKQSNFYISLKKRILDYSASGNVPVFFSTLTDLPYDKVTGDEYPKWVVVETGDKTGEDISEQFIHLHLFTKKDPEHDKIMDLEDTVMGWFVSATGSLDGFILYNTEEDPFEAIGGVNVYQEKVTDIDTYKGGVKFKTITLLCKWAAR